MKVWLAMTYRCDTMRDHAPPSYGGCGLEFKMYCALGVEGPEGEKVIPSPFYGPRCTRCGGTTVHVRWNEDEKFDPPVDAPDGAQVYVVPPGGERTIAKRERRYGGSVYLGDVVTAEGVDLLKRPD